MSAEGSAFPRPDAEYDATQDKATKVPAARDGESVSTPTAPRDMIAAATTVDAGSELVESLMTGMSPNERGRLIEMINSSIEAERLAAFDGTVRRQVDVGVRRRRSSRELAHEHDGQVGRPAAGNGADPADGLVASPDVDDARA
ncbi:hypothetical protein [Frankia sp. AgKG'84/4]|uniref:hypothetical protein n=1 Tax=Frankia sp. AgKG'84/4 TaxID=573490 RepID=UPI00200CE40A|nr:hypothetical protein [Frankia sp. AgKG'84/4]MCL9793847.1 hypothetical protein [Frankia sp. AgKG'84/4]